MGDIDTVRQLIKEAKKVVFFGGAGVSTASGIPDFRSVNGLYKLKNEFGVSYEEMLSRTYFFTYPENFYKFYKESMINLKALPNKAHLALAEYEKEHPNKLTVITQNIDNLHQLGGSKKVLELHGSTYRNHCLNCHTFFDINYIVNSVGIPKCNKCGGMIKPDVVLYEEPLNNDVINASLKAVDEAEVMIVGGSSLMVNPAAGLVRYFKGKTLVLINLEPTRYDRYAHYVFHEDITKVLPELLK